MSPASRHAVAGRPGSEFANKELDGEGACAQPASVLAETGGLRHGSFSLFAGGVCRRLAHSAGRLGGRLFRTRRGNRSHAAGSSRCRFDLGHAGPGHHHSQEIQGGTHRSRSQGGHDRLHDRPGPRRFARAGRRNADRRRPPTLARGRSGLQGVGVAPCARRSRQRAIPDQRGAGAREHLRLRHRDRQPLRRSDRLHHRGPCRPSTACARPASSTSRPRKAGSSPAAALPCCWAATTPSSRAPRSSAAPAASATTSRPATTRTTSASRTRSRRAMPSMTRRSRRRRSRTCRTT